MTPQSLLEFARGPLFAAALLTMVLGLGRLFVIEFTHMAGAWIGMRDRKIPWSQNARTFLSWMIPVKLIPRIRPVMSTVSFLFHAGLLIAPLFLAEHIRLWERGIGISWPAIGMAAADFFTLITMAGCVILLAIRAIHKPTRALSTFWDYALLVLIFIPFATGYAMVHPQWMFANWTTMMLIHVLSGELIFVLMPFTKLSHAALFPFDRVSSDFYWRFPAEGPGRVAAALHGKDVKA